MIGNTTLFINNTRADLNGVVDIQLIDSAKQISDIGAIRTSYTRPFKLPASPTNNRIFSRFSNLNVVRGGYDARKKEPAMISLNGVDKFYGYIKLEGVDMAFNKPVSYRVQFFGSLISFKELLKDDLIEGLDFTEFDHDFDIDTVRTGFKTSLTTGGADGGANGEVIYPFITHTKGLKYSSTDGLYDITTVGTPTSIDRLDYVDLKPALKVKTILEAIETKYDIKLRGSFIESDLFNSLFLWCHKTKGGIITDDYTTNLPIWERSIKQLDLVSFTPDGSESPVPPQIEVYNQDTGQNDDWDKYFNYNCEEIPIDLANQYDVLTYNVGDSGQRMRYEINVSVEVDPAFTEPYDLQVFDRDTGETWVSEFGLVGDSATFFGNVSSEDVELKNIYFKVSSSVLDEFTINISIDGYRDTWCTEELIRSWDYTTDVSSAELITRTRVGFNLPKMKCIDILTSIVKMFNLVPEERLINEVTRETAVFLETADDYYNAGKTIDITNYVDITNNSVERVSPFSKIDFKYSEPSTFLTKNRNGATSTEYGALSWSASDSSDSEYLYDGEAYEVKLDLEKLLYERITDEDNGSLSEILYGWYVNDFTENTPEPELGKPLFFLNTNRSNSSDSIEWEDGVNSTVYNAPSNNYNLGADPPEQSINFGEEFDEYSLIVNPNSLFNTYYSTQITSAYDETARRLIVTAYLPSRIIENYRMNDKFLISAVPFNIDKISINLSNGLSKIELLKIEGFELAYPVKPPSNDVNVLFSDFEQVLWSDDEEALWSGNFVGDTVPKQFSDLYSFTVDTTISGDSGSDQYSLRIFNISKDISVNWGDGSSQTISFNGTLTHTYSSAGIYTITIEGQEYEHSATNSDKDKLIKINNWGQVVVNDNAYDGCSSLESVIANDTPILSGLSGTFKDCDTLTTISVSKFNTKALSDLSNLFDGCTVLKVDLSVLSFADEVNLDGIIDGTDINETGTTTNYDNLLIAVANANILDGGTWNHNACYSANGSDSRASIITDDLYTITDGGFKAFTADSTLITTDNTNITVDNG